MQKQVAVPFSFSPATRAIRMSHSGDFLPNSVHACAYACATDGRAGGRASITILEVCD